MKVVIFPLINNNNLPNVLCHISDLVIRLEKPGALFIAFQAPKRQQFPSPVSCKNILAIVPILQKHIEVKIGF